MWNRKVFGAFLALVIINLPQGLDSWSNLIQKLGAGQQGQLTAMPSITFSIDWLRDAAIALGYVIFGVIASWDTGIAQRLRAKIPFSNREGGQRTTSDLVPTIHPDVARTIDQQRDNLSRFVPVLLIGVRAEGFDLAQPYLDFEINFLNASVYSVFVVGGASGHLTYSDKPMGGELEFESPKIGRDLSGTPVEPGSRWSFILRQYFHPDVREDIRGIIATQRNVRFNFSGVAVRIGAGNDGTTLRRNLTISEVAWSGASPHSGD